MTWRLVVLPILVWAMAFMPLTAHAEEPARLYLQRAPLQDDKQLVVDVVVADVTDLFGAELQLTYDPAQLQVLDANPRLDGIQIAPGPFLAVEDRFVVTNRVDAQSGQITFVVTLLGPAAPVSGSGILATVAFRTIGGGPYAVRVTRAQLVSSALAVIPVTAEDLPLITTDTLAASAPLPLIPVAGWWAIGLAILLAVAIGVVSLVRRSYGSGGPAVSRSGSPAVPNHSLARSSAEYTEQAKRAMARGDLELAHELFSRAVERDPANSEAWLGKGLVAQQAAEKRICFQRVLALDPDNSVACAELQQVAGAG
mgnify:CR=1 FL=1